MKEIASISLDRLVLSCSLFFSVVVIEWRDVEPVPLTTFGTSYSKMRLDNYFLYLLLGT